MLRDGEILLPAPDGLYDTALIAVSALLRRDHTDAFPFLPSLPDQLIDPGCHSFLTAFHDLEIRLGSIMLIFHSRCLRPDAGIVTQKRLIYGNLSHDTLKHLKADISGTQDHRLRHAHIHNGGLQTDLHLASVQDHVHLSHKVFCHMRCLRGTWASRRIGAWRGDIAAPCLDHGTRYRMGG